MPERFREMPPQTEIEKSPAFTHPLSHLDGYWKNKIRESLTPVQARMLEQPLVEAEQREAFAAEYLGVLRDALVSKDDAKVIAALQAIGCGTISLQPDIHEGAGAMVNPRKQTTSGVPYVLNLRSGSGGQRVNVTEDMKYSGLNTPIYLVVTGQGKVMSQEVLDSFKLLFANRARLIGEEGAVEEGWEQYVVPVVNAEELTCPCSSGKKFTACHGGDRS